MMRFYDLADDVAVPRRWHLGACKRGAVDVSDALWDGRVIANPGRINVALSRKGLALDFCITSFCVPVARLAVADAIEHAANGDVQRIPVQVAGHEDFEVLNSVRVVRCLDEGRSVFTKWTKDDHRADLAGRYRMVTRLKILSEHVPADAHFFRVEGWLVALIVSEKVKEAMETTGCLGAKFTEVT